MGCSKRSSKREVYSNTLLLQETKKISHKLTLHLNQLEKEEYTKPKVSRRKEIIKIRAEINEIKMKKTRAKINETECWFFSQTHQKKKKRRGLKSKLEMRKKAQLTLQKYKGS